MPWSHKSYTNLEYPFRSITFVHKNKSIKLLAINKEKATPIVDHKAISKVIKSTLFSYLISKVAKSTLFSYLFFFNDVATPLHKEPSQMHDDHEANLQ